MGLAYKELDANEKRMAEMAAAQIRGRMNQYGLTADDLAKVIGKSRSYAYYIIQGKILPTLSDAKIIARWMNSSVDDIWIG